MSHTSKPKGTIAILTGGGDVPGLNPAIRALTVRALRDGYRVLGIRRGWAGLVELERDEGKPHDEHVIELSEEVVNKVGRTGGTFLHTSRTNPSKVAQAQLPPHLKGSYPGDIVDVTPDVLANLEWLGIDTLIPIGGDDTLSYSKVLDRAGVPLIAIPKTMDNDVQGTEYCIGFSSAITRAKELITRQRTTLGSHERIGVFRIFGRDAGFSALYTAYVTSARCVIPEAPFDLDRLTNVLIEDKRANPSRYSFVIASEGAIWQGGQLAEWGETDSFGHRHKVDVGSALADEIKRRSGEETVSSELTYDLRSGDPDSLDTMVAITFANIAVDLIREGGITGRMIGVQDGKYTHVPIPEPGNPRKVDVDTMYDLDRFRPQYHNRLGRPLLLGASLGVDAGARAMGEPVLAG